MVTSNQSSIELLRSLRMQITLNGLGSFKVFKDKDSGNKQSNQPTDNRRNRRHTDTQFGTVFPEN